ncbi:MAG: hypothetical protein HQM15_05220 [Deltaproteobacteria bacterium]|nr:hypothetical protein [Deltaproteobacteria bacterium]
MSLQHLNIKIFTDENSKQIPLGTYLPIFHRWIQNKVTKEMLIDVADYAHVPAGPGVMLIGHQANISMDNIGSRLGLLYNRKVADEGTNEALLRKTLKAALTHALRLQEDAAVKGKLEFLGNDLQFIVNDRLLAPNTKENLKILQRDLAAVLDLLFGDKNYSFETAQDSRERLNVEVKAKNKVQLQDLIQKI